MELRDIQLPEHIKRAMARQAEAEREKRAKIIAAEGEALAAGQLANASDVMMAHPLALQLRNLQTLIEIAVDKNSTVVFPAPLMSTIGELGEFLSRESQAAATSPPPPSSRHGATGKWSRPDRASGPRNPLARRDTRRPVPSPSAATNAQGRRGAICGGRATRPSSERLSEAEFEYALELALLADCDARWGELRRRPERARRRRGAAGSAAAQVRGQTAPVARRASRVETHRRRGTAPRWGAGADDIRWEASP